MRFVLTIMAFFAAAEVVDMTCFDGQYGSALWQQAQEQGQQIRYQINSFIQQDIAP